MPDDVTDIQAFYDRGVEHESDRLERHQLDAISCISGKRRGNSVNENAASF